MIGEPATQALLRLASVPRHLKVLTGARLFYRERCSFIQRYTRKAYLRGKTNAQAFQSRQPLRVAHLLGSSDHRRLLAFEWVPGTLLTDLCLGAEIDRGSLAVFRRAHLKPGMGVFFIAHQFTFSSKVESSTVTCSQSPFR